MESIVSGANSLYKVVLTEAWHQVINCMKEMNSTLELIDSVSDVFDRETYTAVFKELETTYRQNTLIK